MTSPIETARERLALDLTEIEDRHNAVSVRVFHDGDQNDWSVRYLGDTARDARALLADHDAQAQRIGELEGALRGVLDESGTLIVMAIREPSDEDRLGGWKRVITVARQVMTPTYQQPPQGDRVSPPEGWVLVPRQRLAAAVTALLDAAKNAGIGTRAFAKEIEGYLAALPPAHPVKADVERLVPTLSQAELDSVVSDANLYNYMREVAEANGFESITDAITKAVAAERLVKALDEVKPACVLGCEGVCGKRYDNEELCCIARVALAPFAPVGGDTTTASADGNGLPEDQINWKAEWEAACSARLVLHRAARDLIDQRFSTYRAGNGRDVGVQDENGEKVWLVPHDPMYALEALLDGPAALTTPSQADATQEKDQ